MKWSFKCGINTNPIDIHVGKELKAEEISPLLIPPKRQNKEVGSLRDYVFPFQTKYFNLSIE